MIFVSCDSQKLRNIFFWCYRIAGLLAFLLVAASLFFGDSPLTSLAAVTFISVVTLLSFCNGFKGNPFSISFCVFTFLFLEAPLVFLIISEKDYMIGQSVGPLPFSQIEYSDNYYLGILYLLVCWVSIWMALSFSRFKKIDFPIYFTQKNNFPLLALGLVTAVITLDDSIKFISKKTIGEEKYFSIIPTLFSDQAYLLLAGALLLLKNSVVNSNVNRNNFYLSLIFIIFVYINFSAGSKAAPLTVFIMLVLCPFGILCQIEGARAVSMKFRYILLALIISPILFLMSNVARLSYATDVNPGMTYLFNVVSEFSGDELFTGFGSIAYRLAWGGFDQYLLIFHSFIVNSYDIDTAMNLAQYILKGFINLILPGVPFMEAYAPSSQIFYLVIAKTDLISNYDQISLVSSLNTQPYSLFGFFIIFFGIFAPLALFFFVRYYCNIYNRSDSIIVKLMLQYFFIGMMGLFGAEVLVANTINIFFAVLFIFSITSFFSFNK